MLNALIIVFREAFESFLIVAIILTYLRKTGRISLRSAVVWGVILSIGASFLMGYWLQKVNQPLWEGILALVAAVLVTSFVVHMWRIGHKLKTQMESTLAEKTHDRSTPLAWLGVFGFTVFMISREGMETALMLIQVRQGRFWLGCAIGVLCAAVLASVWARYGHRINIKRFFQVTGLFLILFSAQTFLYAIHEFSEAELLPASEAIHTATEPYSADGRYSLWIVLAIIAVCATWLMISTAIDRRRAAVPASP